MNEKKGCTITIAKDEFEPFREALKEFHEGETGFALGMQFRHHQDGQAIDVDIERVSARAIWELALLFERQRRKHERDRSAS